jgi:hypothetical protein
LPSLGHCEYPCSACSPPGASSPPRRPMQMLSQIGLEFEDDQRQLQQVKNSSASV